MEAEDWLDFVRDKLTRDARGHYRPLEELSVEIDADLAERAQQSTRSLIKPVSFDDFYPSVIISYATSYRKESDDNPGKLVAAGVVKGLFDLGIECYTDLMTPGGRNWEEYSLRIHSERSRVMVVLMTRAFFQSVWCLLEVKEALDHHCLILPVRVEAVRNKGTDISRDKASMWPDDVIDKWVCDSEGCSRKGKEATISRTNELKLARYAVAGRIVNVASIPAQGTVLENPKAIEQVAERVRENVLSERPKQKPRHHDTGADGARSTDCGKAKIIDAYFAVQCQPSRLLRNLDGRPEMLRDLDGIHRYIRDDSSFDRNYNIYLTDGTQFASASEPSSRIRVLFWCARGVNESGSSFSESEPVAAICSSSHKPEVVVVCMEYGAQRNARRLYDEMNLTKVIWINTNPFDGFYALTRDVLLPFCIDYSCGIGFATCAKALVPNLRKKIFCDEASALKQTGVFCEARAFDQSRFLKACLTLPLCVFYANRKGVETCTRALVSNLQQSRISRKAGDFMAKDDMSSALDARRRLKGDEEVMPMSQIDMRSFISLNWDCHMKDLKVDRGDLIILEDLKDYLSPVGQDFHYFVYIKARSKHFWKRSRALALYACLDMAADRAFGKGVYRVACKSHKSNLPEHIREALVWVDLIQWMECPFKDVDDLLSWLGHNRTVAVLLTADSEASFERFDTIVKRLKDMPNLKVNSVDIEQTGNPVGNDNSARYEIPANSLVGSFAIRSRAKSDGIVVPLLDLPNVSASKVAKAVNDTLSECCKNEEGEGELHDGCLYCDNDGSVRVRFLVRDVRSLTMLRDSFLLGKAAHQLAAALKLHEDEIEVDRTSIAEMFESMILQLEILTEHQQKKMLESDVAIAREKTSVHIQGMAGTGKTFLALNLVLNYLENTNDDGKVLYVCSSKATAIQFCKWIWHRMIRLRNVNETLEKVFLLLLGTPNMMFRSRFDSSRGVLSIKDQKENIEFGDIGDQFGLVVVDEAHDVFKSDSGTSPGDLKLHLEQSKCQLILVSDASQSSSDDIHYPTHQCGGSIREVKLSEVCRCTKRIVLGARCFQFQTSDGVPNFSHNSDGMASIPILFPRRPETERFEAYAEKIWEAVEDVSEKFSGLDLHHRLAIVVPDAEIHKRLSAPLQKCLERQSLRLVDSMEACSHCCAHRSTRESHIVFDSVGNVAGLEFLIVLGVDLDSSLTSVGTDARFVCSRIFRAITRAQLMFYLINEQVKNGWCDFLAYIEGESDDSKETFNFDDELKKFQANAVALHCKEIRTKGHVAAMAVPFQSSLDGMEATSGFGESSEQDNRPMKDVSVEEEGTASPDEARADWKKMRAWNTSKNRALNLVVTGYPPYMPITSKNRALNPVVTGYPPYMPIIEDWLGLVRDNLPHNEAPLETLRIHIDEQVADRVRRSIVELLPCPFDSFYPKTILSYATGYRQNFGDYPGKLVAAGVVKGLFDRGIECYTDLMTPGGRNNWDDSMRRIHDYEGDDKRAQAVVLIVLLTRAFFHSISCLEEVRYALEHNCFILPVRVEATSENGMDISRDQAGMWPNQVINAWGRYRGSFDTDEIGIGRIGELRLARDRVREHIMNVASIPAHGTLLSDESRVMEDLVGRINEICFP